MEHGFEIVETPAANIDPAAAQQPVQDLMGLLEGENEPQVDPAGEPPGAPAEPPVVETPPQLAEGESAPIQEQPVVEDSEQGEPEPTHTVRVNGEDQQVTLNGLKEGFQLKSDYTRKTQELAEREQQLGMRVQGVSQQEEQYSQLVDAMKQRLETMIPPEPDWPRLAESDPIEHTRQRAAWDQLHSQMKAVEQEQERLEQGRQEKFQQNYQGYMQFQQNKLFEARPELKEPGKAQEFYTTLTQFGVNEYGFSPQDLASVGDHRIMLMADDARKYRLLQSGVKGKEVVIPHVPTLKPGSVQKAETVASKALRKATDRLERTGDTRDAAAAIEALL